MTLREEWNALDDFLAAANVERIDLRPYQTGAGKTHIAFAMTAGYRNQNKRPFSPALPMLAIQSTSIRCAHSRGE